MRMIESNQPLVESKFWNIIRDYYIFKGPAAWTSEETPSFVTNCCYTANYYAEIILHAIKDWQQQYPDQTLPFYIIELSSGLGELAFYILKFLAQFKEQYSLNNIKYCYVLTDIALENIKAWQQSQAFEKFLEEKVVDFAFYDLNHPEILELQNQKIKLDTTVLKKPSILIANYLFDSTPCDVFKIFHGNVRRGMTTIKVPENFDIEKPTDLQDLDFKMDYTDIANDNIYSEPFYNDLIAHYRQSFSSTVVSLPISGFNYLNFFLRNSSGKMLFLIADKGYSETEMIEELDSFHLNYHAALSTLVNFHALEKFFEDNHSGSSFYQDRFTALTSAVYSAGMSLNDLPQLQNFLKMYQREMSPQEYCRLIFQLSHLQNLDALSLLAIFRLSKQDPIVFRLFSRQLFKITNPKKIYFNERLRKIVKATQSNIFPLSQPKEMNYWLASIYLAMGDYSEALNFLQRYTPTEKLEYEYLQRLTECYEQLGDAIEFNNLQPRLKKAKLKFRFNALRFKLKIYKSWLKRHLRFLFLIIGMLIFIYFLINHSS